MRKIEFHSSGDNLCAWAEGEGPFVVMCHGGLQTHRDTMELFAPLKRQFTLVAPDVRGHGASVCRHVEHHCWDCYAADVIALLDQLSCGRAAIGGSSFGANVAIAAAMRYPERFDAVVLNVPFSGGNAPQDDGLPVQPDYRAELAMLLMNDGLEAAVDRAWRILGGDDGVRDAIHRAWALHDFGSLTAFFSSGPGEPFDRVRELKTLTMPVLVIPGTDPFHPRAVAEAYMTVLPNGTFRESPNSTAETDEVLWRTVGAFLQDAIAR